MATDPHSKTFLRVDQIRTAIKLRHNGKQPADEVLTAAEAALERLTKHHRISEAEAAEVKNRLRHARQMDKVGVL